MCVNAACYRKCFATKRSLADHINKGKCGFQDGEVVATQSSEISNFSTSQNNNQLDNDQDRDFLQETSQTQESNSQEEHIASNDTENILHSQSSSTNSYFLGRGIGTRKLQQTSACLLIQVASGLLKLLCDSISADDKVSMRSHTKAFLSLPSLISASYNDPDRLEASRKLSASAFLCNQLSSLVDNMDVESSNFIINKVYSSGILPKQIGENEVTEHSGKYTPSGITYGTVAGAPSPILSDKLKKSVVAKVRAGQKSDAVKIIEGQLAGEKCIRSPTSDPEVLQQIRDKHPARSSVRDDLPMALPDEVAAGNRFQIHSKDILAIFPQKKLSATAFSSWTLELIEDILTNYGETSEALLGQITQLFNHMKDGRAGCEDLWLASRLVPIEKSDGSLRPIAITDCWIRVFGKVIIRKIGPEISKHFGAVQLGVGTRSGVEHIVHFLRVFADDIERENVLAGLDDGSESPVIQEHELMSTSLNPDLGVALVVPAEQRPELDGDVIGILSVDTKNAFNSISRAAIFRALLINFPYLCSVFRWLYGKSTPIYSSDGIFICYSGTGVRQGDPLGGFFYCIGTNIIEKELLIRFPKVHLLSYMDDQSLVGKVSDLNLAFKFLVAELGLIGLIVNKQKSSLFTSTRGLRYIEQLASRLNYFGTTRITTDGIKILGSALGCSNFVGPIILDSIMVASSVVEILHHLESSIAFIIMQQCIKSRPYHIMRTTESWKISDSLQLFDSKIQCAITKLIDPSAINLFTNNPVSASILSLPIKLGGCGLRKCFDIKEAAYSSSLFGALQFMKSNYREVLQKFSGSTHGIPIQITTGTLPETPIIPYFADIISCVVSNNDSIDNPKDLAVLSEQDIHITQKLLTTVVDKKTVVKIINQLTEDNRLDYLAWYMSNRSDRFSALWLSCATNFSSKHRLSDREFSVNLLLRLVLPLLTSPPSNQARSCTCSPNNLRNVEDDHFHFLSCCKNKYHRSRRHSALNYHLQKVIPRICRNSAVSNVEHVLPNVMVRGVERHLRADFHAIIHNTTKLIDGGVASPSVESNKVGASKKPFFSSLNYAEIKRKKYAAYYPLDSNPTIMNNLVPFIIESTGAFGPDAMQFYKFLLQNVQGCSVDQARLEWRKFRMLVSISLAKNISMSIDDSENNLFHFADEGTVVDYTIATENEFDVDDDYHGNRSFCGTDVHTNVISEMFNDGSDEAEDIELGVGDSGGVDDDGA
jgi:uncharacterized protein YdaT